MPAMSLPALVVFSHLRWNFVYQRPQHLLSRLARRWRVVFVEEPVHDGGAPGLDVREAAPNVTVVVPRTPVPQPGFHDDQLALLEPMVAGFFRDAGIAEAVVWLYTPMALPLVKTLGVRSLAYDCMDELSAFKDAPRQLRQRETALLKRADVVFTGGPSLHEAKRDMHPNVHCIPSSVDAAHFDPRRLVAGCEHARAVHALQGALPAPRLGFYGVIDERLDTALVGELADARPDWQILMVGPIVKIDPAALPQRPNLHWLGMQPYERLPHFLAGWELAIMPFAINDATRFISPTKTLEYMAADKPIVSTPVRDVVAPYRGIVAVAGDAAGFVTACEELLEESEAARAGRSCAMRETVAALSWDRSADHIHDLLVQAALRAARTPGREARGRLEDDEPLVAAAGARV